MITLNSGSTDFTEADLTTAAAKGAPDGALVLTWANAEGVDMRVTGLVSLELGLNGAAATFTLYGRLTEGSAGVWQIEQVVKVIETAVTAVIPIKEFVVPAGDTLSLYVHSSNASDTDVDGSVYLNDAQSGQSVTEVGGTTPVTISDINSEIDTALADINLDHLMKTPVASNSDMTAEVADGTVLSNIMTKGSDTSDFLVATDSLEALRDNQPGGGSGAITFVYSLYTNESEETGPISDATVWVTTDEAGTNVVASGATDVNGAVTFYLDAATYYLWRSKPGYTFTNPDTETVA